MRFLIRVVVNAFSLWIVSLMTFLTVTVTPFPPGETLQLVLTLLAVGALFAVVNSLVGGLIRVLAFPLYVLTLGLISFVINGLMLWLTAWITGFWGWGLAIGNFWWGVVAAIVISIINWLFGIVLRPREKHDS